MLEQNIWSDLTSSTLVGKLSTMRVYPVLLPQTPTYPAITYQCVALSPDYSMSDLASKGVENRRIQVDCWAVKYEDAKQLAYNVHTVMAASTRYKSVLENESDSYEPDVDTFRITQEYSCWQTTT